MSDVACGYLTSTGGRCDKPAVAFVQVTPESTVPACQVHAQGAPVTPVEEE